MSEVATAFHPLGVRRLISMVFQSADKGYEFAAALGKAALLTTMTEQLFSSPAATSVYTRRYDQTTFGDVRLALTKASSIAATLDAMLDELGQRDRELVELRYGLQTGKALPFKDVGAAFSMQKVWARKWDGRSIYWFRKPENRRRLELALASSDPKKGKAVTPTSSRRRSP